MSAPAFAHQGKSPDAFRTISEVAADLDVPQHVLRFWESRFAQIKPVKRAGGRRFYRPEDVDLLRGIRALLYSDGFTIRGVQKILKDKGLRHVAGIGRGAPEASAPPVVERVVFVERPVEAPVKKRPTHLRAVPSPKPMSLPFFDALETEAAPAPVMPRAAAAVTRLAVEERARLQRMLGELDDLKKRLRDARKTG